MSAATASPTASVESTRQTRLARVAVAALFLTNGALFANVVPRYPQIKADLGLSNAVLGAALAALPLGALLAGLLAAAAIRRFRSSRVAALGVVLLAVATFVIPFASNGIAFGAVLFVIGALDAVVDVAQNAHGLRVQRLYGRSIVNSFHGVWSIGAVLGGLMGSAAAGLRVPLAIHLSVSTALFGVVALVAYRFLLPGPEDAERPAVTRVPGADHDPAATRDPAADGHPAAPAAHDAGRRAFAGSTARMLAALGVLAACGALVEDAGASWGAIYLSGDLRTDAATAGLAFVALQVAMTVGRLTGDRAVDRFGQRTVVRAGGALATVGMGAALAVPTVGTALAGFALAGLGVATLVPAAMHAADELPGLPDGTGLTIVSWLLRGGFLLSPPLVGFVADLVSLRVGLLSVVLAGLVTVILARVLADRRQA
ncbi:MFS family permease [Streptosporangium becharense]|uniref:MFS family permease n=1 Tax=Streptosporangium becharense TaxID=1816182 RepID=A0A7W9MJN1_9ACTN|nr:MFS transporter [Streptosporangium becharense]MBB2915062.1 MFS family permease [Streptosporangium becharense]MBB5822866.1 MFS family permease [Streptosporangium becharense]